MLLQVFGAWGRREPALTLAAELATRYGGEGGLVEDIGMNCNSVGSGLSETVVLHWADSMLSNCALQLTARAGGISRDGLV